MRDMAVVKSGMMTGSLEKSCVQTSPRTDGE